MVMDLKRTDTAHRIIMDHSVVASPLSPRPCLIRPSPLSFLSMQVSSASFRSLKDSQADQVRVRHHSSSSSLSSHSWPPHHFVLIRTVYSTYPEPRSEYTRLDFRKAHSSFLRCQTPSEYSESARLVGLPYTHGFLSASTKVTQQVQIPPATSSTGTTK